MMLRITLLFLGFTVFFISAFAQTAPSACQLYWGAIQVRIEFDSLNQVYSGRADASMPELLRAVDREPRLWNGKSLEAVLQFRIDELAVHSDYNNPKVYDTLRAPLKTWAESLDSSQTVQIRGLLLPNGQYAQLEIGLNGKRPAWMSPNRSRIGPPTAIDSTTFSWGGYTADNPRIFIRLNDFWDLMALDPVVITAKGDTIPPGLIGGWLMTAEDKYIGLTGQKADEGLSLQDFRKKLESYGHLLVPGAGLSVYQFSGGLLRVGISRLNLRIVDDEDPRLSLKTSDLRRFRFQWGHYSEDFYNIFGLSFDTPAGKVYADAPVTLQNFGLTAADIIQMLRETPQVLVDGKICTGLRFDMAYKGERCTVFEGLTPPRFIRYLEEQLEEYGQVRIFNIRTDAYDLGRQEILLEAKPLPPKPPLRG